MSNEPSRSRDVELIQGHYEQHLTTVRELFTEYADWLGFELDFQDFETELATLPGEYAPPAGRILLAECEEKIAGCVGLRRFKDGVCEMKRLYVRPAFQGRGIGKALAVAIIDEAKRIGYECMWLDTLPAMTSAITLYESFGFTDIDPYRHNPFPDARFMELMLRP